jgi:hypothetical protein
MRLGKLLFLILYTFSLSGCGISIPTSVTPTITKNRQPISISDDLLVTLGPRRLLEEISQEITNRSKDIEVVDALVYRDTVFPDGGWKLKQLLTPENCQRVYNLLQVDYLVLIGRINTETGEEEGFFIPLVVGAMSAERTVKLSATIYDLKSSEFSCEVYSEAQGKERVFSYVILVAGKTPQILTAAVDGLAEGVVDEINMQKHNSKTRIVVMAVENPTQVNVTN